MREGQHTATKRDTLKGGSQVASALSLLNVAFGY